MDLEREQDIEQLRRIALAQKAQIEQLLRTLNAKCKELEALKGSEGELQMTLDLIETLTAQKNAAALAAANADEPAPKKRNPRSKFGPTPQPSLPVITEVLTLDPADQTCPSCGGDLAPMKGQYEQSELIDFVEVQYQVRRILRQKYVCTCGSCVDTAEGPERAMPGGRYSRKFAIKVIIDKYLDHLPLERQVRILRRHGLDVRSQTLWGLARSVAEQLERVSDAILAHVLAQPVIGLDQTGWPRLGAGRKARPWQMWCLTAPGAVVHRIRDDKSAATFKHLVGEYAGIIVCDDLATHDAGARDGPCTLAGCWAHVYRKFEEAAADHPEAERALAWIGKLYDIDERADGDLGTLAKLRQVDSAAVIAEMKDWLWTQAVLKTLSIGKASAYVIKNWDKLTRFLDDPRVPLDNNGTERAIRGPVVGRKNHDGSKSRRGTQVASTLYTIIETAKLHGLDPAEYMLEALRAAERGVILLPWQARE